MNQGEHLKSSHLFTCSLLSDISQVQCIKSYQAQEHDELTLEKADILHAKTITSDGENLGDPFRSNASQFELNGAPEMQLFCPSFK